MDKKTILNELNKIFIDDISEKIVDKVIFTPKTNEELQEAVDFWCKDRIEGEKKYGNIYVNGVKLGAGKKNLYGCSHPFCQCFYPPLAGILRISMSILHIPIIMPFLSN